MKVNGDTKTSRRKNSTTEDILITLRNIKEQDKVEKYSILMNAGQKDFISRNN